jgi:uncharacterized lipoprotein YmbA
VKSFSIAVGTLCLLSACATGRPDHYYILTSQPPAASPARTAPVTQVALSVSLPSLVDRSEMVLNTGSDGVIVLEHERWGAPLTDLMTQTLAQDIERRRPDLLVAGRGLAPASGAAVKMTVNVVQMSVRQGDKASLEAQWRILNARSGQERGGQEEVGGAAFSAPLRGDNNYAGVAQAVSECLGSLADRLVARIPLQ